jgi:hypothetical protein
MANGVQRWDDFRDRFGDRAPSFPPLKSGRLFRNTSNYGNLPDFANSFPRMGFVGSNPAVPTAGTTAHGVDHLRAARSVTTFQ